MVDDSSVYDNTICVIKYTPELISTTLTFSLSFIGREYEDTIFLNKTGTVSYDNTIFLINTIKYDNTIYLQFAKQYDEKIFIWKNSSGNYDENIILIKTSVVQYDNTITITFTNGPQYIPYDDSIYLVKYTPELINIVLTIERYILIYDDTIILLNSIPQSYDNTILLINSIKYDETIRLETTTPQLSQYDNTIYLIKFGGGGGVDAVIKSYNDTIYLVKGYPMFDETIVISKGLVCQIGDVVRNSSGKAIGMIMNGLDFSI